MTSLYVIPRHSHGLFKHRHSPIPLPLIRLSRRYSYGDRDTSAPIVGSSGSIPLHFAAANSHENVVRTLLLHGAHADHADKHGVTPEILARENGKEGTLMC